MGFYSSLVFGFCTGVFVVFGVRVFQKKRSQDRIQKAINVAMLSCMNRDDLRKLISGDIFPSWVQFPEFERVNWLNKQLKEIWPYVSKAASAMIKDIVEPTLDMYRPPLLRSMHFSKFVLGSVAPQLGGIKVVESAADEIILEVDFKWGGDPSIILSIQTLVGVPLQVQVKDLQFWGVFRIALTPLVPQMPCFGALVIAVKNKPKVNFILKVAGGDVANIPRLTETIEGMIRTAITDSLLWPVRIVIPIIPGDYKHLELHNVGVLEVKLVEAKGLPNIELVGTVDPFATVFVRPIPSLTKKTRAIANTVSPRWNESFTFDVQDIQEQRLAIQVWDEEDLIGARALGEVALPLMQLTPGKLADLWLPLVKDIDRPKADIVDRGSVHLELLYRPLGSDGKAMEFRFTNKTDSQSSSGLTLRERGMGLEREEAEASASSDSLQAKYERGVLSLTVISGRDLVSKDLNGFSDPFVNLTAQANGIKKRTQVMAKTLNPVWEETFDFLVEDGKREMIIAEVWDHDLFGRKDFMGRIAITLTRAMMEGSYEEEYELQDTTQGFLKLKFIWNPL